MSVDGAEEAQAVKLCQTCKWWEQDPNSTHYGWCGLTFAEGDEEKDEYRHPDSDARCFVFFPDDAFYRVALGTFSHFGCTQHEEQAKP